MQAPHLEPRPPTFWCAAWRGRNFRMGLPQCRMLMSACKQAHMPSATVITTLAILAVLFWLVSALMCVDYRSRQSKQLRLMRMSWGLSCSQTILIINNKHLPRPSKPSKWLNDIKRETVLLLCVLKIEEISAGKRAAGSIGFSTCTITFTCHPCTVCFNTMEHVSVAFDQWELPPKGHLRSTCRVTQVPSVFTGCERDKMDGTISQQERLGNLIIASTKKREGWSWTIFGRGADK